MRGGGSPLIIIRVSRSPDCRRASKLAGPAGRPAIKSGSESGSHGLRQGTEPPGPIPIPIPIPIPDLPGIRGGGPTPAGFAGCAHGDRGSSPIPIPDLPESAIQLSTIEYYKGVELT